MAATAVRRRRRRTATRSRHRRVRPAAPAVALLAAGSALAVRLAGGGAAVWMCLPLAQLAVAATPRARGGVLASGVVVLAGLLGADAAGRAGGQPVVLVLVIAAACTGVLLVVRERFERERRALRHVALTDPLTGASNRRSLMMRADYEITRHHRSRRTFAVVMLDLDGFKGLNDRFGHAAGDDLLRRVSAALRDAMRDQDTVARLGGDEFCVLAPETPGAGLAPLGDRVRDAVRRVSSAVTGVSGSVGVAIFPADGRTVEALLNAADTRLLAAKREHHRGRSGRRAA
jgi:diguanylate cyclase (GGDEF)-like protein